MPTSHRWVPAILAFHASIGLGQTISVDGIEVTGFGVFGYAEVIREERTEQGSRKITARDIRVASQTDRIPYQKGLAFGIRYVVKGKPSGATVPVRVIQTPVEPCIKHDGSIVQRWEEVWSARIGIARHNGSRITPDGEKPECENERPISGFHTIEIYFEGRKLAEKRFEIYVP